MKLALAQTLDCDKWPKLLEAPGILRFAAGFSSDADWVVDGANQYMAPADPGQDAVISAARLGRSFVVQGPPGTGKSQTIVNVAANLAFDGRRVLVAAEKTAAIDVVGAPAPSVQGHRIAEAQSPHSVGYTAMSAWRDPALGGGARGRPLSAHRCPCRRRRRPSAFRFQKIGIAPSDDRSRRQAAL